VKYYETYDDVKYIYLVMELCSGGELFERISDTKKPFSEKEAATVVSKLLKAIIHCHTMNISHRDIKPENIMYGADGEVKLIDFGLAK
jgi:serine/threonine protein kinase